MSLRRQAAGILAIILAAGLLGGCPTYGPTFIKCDESTACPSGYVCGASGFCTSTRDCVPDAGNGAAAGACGVAGCASGYAADGVCCNTACTGACMACVGSKTGGADGTCLPIKGGTDPDSECPGSFACNGNGACATSCQGCTDLISCEADTFCNAGQCAPKKPSGDPAPSCGGDGCASGNVVDGHCCQSSSCGTCETCANGSGTCQKVTCGSGDGCSGYCNASGACEPLLANGATPDATCGAPSCTSDSVADSVCCSMACSGACEGCIQSLTEQPDGQCTQFADGTDPRNECLGSYACKGGACATSCSTCTDTACLYGQAYCSSGQCVARLADNSTADSTCGAASCISGNVTDGQCSAAPPMSCNDLIGEPSGTYTIQGMTVYCDMETAGGGWTLVLAYNHQAGGSAGLAVGAIPTDPNNGYSQMSTAQEQMFSFTEVRFYCTSNDPAVVGGPINFYTDNADAVAYAFGTSSTNSASYWNTGYTLLPDAGSPLPAAANYAATDTMAPLTDQPFFEDGQTTWALEPPSVVRQKFRTIVPRPNSPRRPLQAIPEAISGLI